MKTIFSADLTGPQGPRGPRGRPLALGGHRLAVALLVAALALALTLALATRAFAEERPLYQATAEQWRNAGAVQRMEVTSAWAVGLIGEERLAAEGGFVALETRGFEMLTCLQRALADVDGATPVTEYVAACALALGWPLQRVE